MAPIHLAAFADCGEVVDLLLATRDGAEMVKSVSWEGYTPLTFAGGRYHEARQGVSRT